MSKNAQHSDVFEGHKKLEKNVTLLGAATLLVRGLAFVEADAGIVLLDRKKAAAFWAAAVVLGLNVASDCVKPPVVAPKSTRSTSAVMIR